jgi:hypothetical protein
MFFSPYKNALSFYEKVTRNIMKKKKHYFIEIWVYVIIFISTIFSLFSFCS